MPVNAAPVAAATGPKPVANVTTGANPRGVSIVVPKAAPTRPVVIAHRPALGAPSVIPHGPLLATVTPTAVTHSKFLSGLGHVVGTLGSQIYHLPATTLEGAVQLGVPTAKALGDLISGNTSGALHNAGAAGHQIVNGVTHDPFVQAITQGSAQPLLHNPLGAILDATAVFGAGGKALGAAGRAASVDAAAMGGRAARQAAPGIEGTAIAKGYSPNAATKVAQVFGDRLSHKAFESQLPGVQRVAAGRAGHELNLQVAASHAAEQGAHGAEVSSILKTLKQAKPSGKEEAAVAPLIAMTGLNSREGLQQILDNATREPTPPNLDTQASRARMISDLQAAVAKADAGKFDFGATQRAAAAYKPLSAALEEQQARLGMRAQEEMAQRLDNARALLEPNVHYLKKAAPDPRLLSQLKDTAQAVRDRQAELDAARAEAQASEQVHRAVGKHVTSTLQRLPVKYQGLPPGSDIVPGSSADRLVGHLLDERQMVKDSHPAARAENKASTQAAQAALKDALREHKAMVRTVKANPVRGTMIEDPAVPAMTKGALKGMNVRPLTPADVAALRSQDPLGGQLQSFVSARNPERVAAQPTSLALGRNAGDRIIPMMEKGRAPYTGEALSAGDLRTGWSALPNTLLGKARAISTERETQAFLRRFSLPTEIGTDHHTDFNDARAHAADYQRRTGIKVSTLNDNGLFRNVPTAAVRELNRQRALDTRGNTFLARANRVFRKTVLPYSPKLPIMHNVENVTRTALLERGNLIRAIGDYRRGRSILGAATPDQRARLQTLVTPGSLSRTGVGGEAEDVGKLVLDRSAPRAAVHAAVHGIDQVATQIIHGQRILEKGAQTVALGAHGRTLLQEMGHSWADANLNVHRYAQKLADGLATPADAERAANAMHAAYGKYNAFSANSRMALRYMPFGSWYANAAKLVFVTLPRDHPLTSALLQDVAHANQQQWDAQHKGLPGDMQTSLPVGPSAYLDIGKLTPIGLPNQAPETTAAQLVLPQFTSAALALAGKDPFATDLKGPGTGYGQSASPAGIMSPTGAEKAQSALSAVEQAIQSMGGPINDLARGLFAHGGTLYNTSTPDLHLLTGGQVGRVDVKPGSTAQQTGWLHLPPALDKVLDPFHPTTFHGAGTTNLKGLLGTAPVALGRLPNQTEGRAPVLEGR